MSGFEVDILTETEKESSVVTLHGTPSLIGKEDSRIAIHLINRSSDPCFADLIVQNQRVGIYSISPNKMYVVRYHPKSGDHLSLNESFSPLTREYCATSNITVTFYPITEETLLNYNKGKTWVNDYPSNPEKFISSYSHWDLAKTFHIPVRTCTHYLR